MIIIRRFFDAAATETAGPGAAPAAPPNIAQLLASKGVRTDEADNSVAIPSINTEETKEQPPKATEQPKAETATPAKEPKPEEPTPQPAPPPSTPPAPGPAPVPSAASPDWREVLKKHPEPAEIMKALGYDDKILTFMDRWKKGGDIKEYLQAVTVDFEKMTPEQLMRHQLSRDYPDLDSSDFEELYRMKVIEQYKLDPDIFNENDVRRGKILLQADARKLREQFTKDQQNYILPPPPEVDPLVEQQRQEAIKQQQQAEKEYEQYKEYINNHTLTKDFLTSKMLTFGEGDEAFKYEVEDPNRLLELVFDGSKASEKFFDEKEGKRTPNVFKHLAVAALLQDDHSFFTNIAKHFKKIGAKQIADRIENVSQPGAPTTRDLEPSDPIAQLARAGVITGG